MPATRSHSALTSTRSSNKQSTQVARIGRVQSPRGFVWPRSGRIPTLDGIRAVSIALVVCAHATGTGALPMSARASHIAADLGVRTFFVLSGFLITTLLLRERQQTGRI